MRATWRRRLPKIGVRTLHVLAWVLVWLGLTLLAAGLDIRIMWGDITVDQMLTNITGATGEGGGGLVLQAVCWIGVFPLILTILLFVGRVLWKRRSKKRRAKAGVPQYRRGPVMRGVAPIVAVVLVAGITVTGTSTFSSAVSLPSYIKSVNSDKDLGDYFHQPVVTNDKNKRNIVVVYLESGEQKLADDTLFEKDMYTDLEKSTEDWSRIHNFQQYDGGGWTMAGMVSTQCGIPLRGKSAATGSSVMNKADANDPSYLGGQTCFGDLLKQHGYTNEYIGGANADFAAKGLYYKTHGYDKIKDLNTWQAMGEKPQDIRSDWGLRDKRLMAHAKQEVSALHKQSKKTGKPFNLSMITLDTHEPVHVYPGCKIDTKDKLASVWACSTHEVAGFVDYMRAKGIMKDTSVVIMGDHLKHMGVTNKYHKELDDRDDRTIFNRIWIPGTKDQKTPLGKPRGDVDQLNMLPTMLEAAGLETRDRQAALGVSAFSPQIPRDSAQALHPQTYKDLLEARSKDFYKKAWIDPSQVKPTGGVRQEPAGEVRSND